MALGINGGAEAQAHLILGGEHRRAGRPVEARAAYERAAAFYRQAEAWGALGCALADIAAIHHRSGLPDRAAECFDEALAAVRAGRVPVYEAGVLGNRASFDLAQGDPAIAAEGFGAAEHIYREAGQAVDATLQLCNRGAALMVQGRFDEAKEVSSEGRCEASSALGHRKSRGYGRRKPRPDPSRRG